MPKYNNSFGTPSYREEEIYGYDDKLIGTIRLKPTGILWKPSGQGKYYSIDLDTFGKWITDKSTGASRTTQ